MAEANPALPVDPTPATDPSPSLLTTPAVEPPKTEEPKKDDPPKAAEPLDFTKITLPEGLTIPDDLRDKFVAVAGKHGISQEVAQELINLQAEASKTAAEASTRAFTELQQTWQTEVKNDPEIGGAKLEGTLTKISKVLDQFGSPQLREALDVTGAGNNPHIIRFMSKLAEKLTEGSPVTGGSPAPTKPVSQAAALYPNLPNGG